MFKLLPTEEKKRLKGEYKTRLFIILFLFIFCAEIVAAVSLLPAFVLSGVKEKSIQAEQLLVDRTLEGGKDLVLEEEIKKAKNQIAQLRVEDPYLSVVDIVKTIVNDKTTAIKIQSFQLNRFDPEQSELRIIGIGQSRESIVAFTSELEKESIFTEVELPVSDLAQSKNISFSVRLVGTF